MGLIYHEYFVNSALRYSETGNSLFSPESVSSLFNATHDGYDAMSQQFALGIFNQPEEKYSKSFDLFDHKLSKKSKVFIRKEVQLQDQMKINFKNKFECDVEEIDVENSESVNSTNKWISDNTGDRSCDVLADSNIINITKCNFAWHKNIEVNTTIQKFYKEVNETVDTEFIDLNGELGYVEMEDLDARMIEVPLINENLKMVFILPNKKDGLKNLENKFGSYHLELQIPKIKQYQMKLSIPKFKLQQELDLRDIFYKMNEQHYPFQFGGNNSHVGKMKSIASLEISETDIKAVAVTVCELLLDPLINEMIYETSIENRFAKTVITSKVENLECVAQEIAFSMILPEDAFITEFIIEIKGKSYKSYIKEKQEAKDIYDSAVASGKSAAHVAVSTRDSNTFTVSVNVEPRTEIKFLFTYEELLQRRYDQYELVLNIQPGKLVNILKVKVKVDEMKQPKFVKTPAIRSGNEITNNEQPNLLSKIESSDSTVVVRFEPDLENQKEIAKELGLEEVIGISGQFVVQYDVELDPSDGEVLISDGYFVHFYVPDDLPPLSKHVIFALDTSGSMGGRKIEQLQDAMKCILDQIRTNDLVDILEFTTNVSVHDIESEATIIIDYENEENYHEPFYKYERLNFPSAKPANRDMIQKAKGRVDQMRSTNSTNIIGGIETALFLAKRGQEKYTNYQPIIIFLTDGEPNVGVSDTDEITKIVTKINYKYNKVPIFSLSFGEDADKSFLRKLSLANFGFNRHIYEAADASLQLQQFYKQISSPLLSDVSFKYSSTVDDVTRTTFPLYFRGSDIIICGRYMTSDALNFVALYRREECVQLKPHIKTSVTQIERLWAYLTVKQLLEEIENAEDTTVLTKKALDLALKYSFVTKITSLVVVKPEDSSVVDTESASSNPYRDLDLRCDAMQLSCSTFCQGSSKKALKYCARRRMSVPRILRISVSNAIQFTGNMGASLKRRFSNTTEKPTKTSIPTELVADRPFLMMIQYKLDGKYVVLFMGRISIPV